MSESGSGAPDPRDEEVRRIAREARREPGPEADAIAELAREAAAHQQDQVPISV